MWSMWSMYDTNEYVAGSSDVQIQLLCDLEARCKEISDGVLKVDIQAHINSLDKSCKSMRRAVSSMEENF